MLELLGTDICGDFRGWKQTSGGMVKDGDKCLQEWGAWEQIFVLYL